MSSDVVYQSKGALIQFIETNMGTVTATSFIGDGALLQNVTGSGGGGGGAPTDAQYVTLATDGDLSAERVLTAGTNISLTNDGTNITVASTTFGDVSVSGTPSNNEVPTWTDGTTIKGEGNLTFDGSTLTVAGATSITGDTTLGNASTDTVTFNAKNITLTNVGLMGGTDNTVLICDGTSVATDEIDSRVWGSTLVDASGTPADNQVGIWTDANTMEGSSNLTFDGSTLDVSGDVDIASGQYLRTNGIAAVGSSGNEVQFGSAATSKTLALRTDVGTALSIDAAGVVTFDVAPATGTDNTVLIINSSNEIIRDEIDSKVWAGDLVDYTGTPVNNQVAIWTDTDTLEGDSGLTFDGNTLTIAEPTSGDTLVLGRANGEASIKAVSSEHMIIDSDGQYLSLNHYENDDVVLGYGGGHVSIGTNNSPDYLLEVSSETAYEGVATVTQYNNSNAVDGSNLYLRRARGTMASPTIVQEDDNIGGIRWYSYNGSDWDLSGEIKVECDATPAADDTPGRIVFSTTPDNDDSLTERMRIDSAGLVGIGTSAPQVELHISDAGSPQIRLSDPGASDTQDVVAYMEYYRGDDTTRIGWCGYGSTTNEHFTINNQTATGSFEVKTNNTTAFTVDYQGNATVAGDLTVTGNNIKDSTDADVITFLLGSTTIESYLTVDQKLRINGNGIRDSGGSDAITFDGSQNTTITGDLTVSTAGSTIAQEAWNAPTLESNWSNYGGDYVESGYMKDTMGFVHIRGMIDCVGAGDDIFTLPAGYRPASKLIFVVLYYDNGTYRPGRVDITSAGVVSAIFPSAPAAADWVSLEGLTFDTR